MTTEVIAEDARHARWTFRVRLSSTARRQLEGEWDRCRWVWNESVAQSKIVHSHNRSTGEKRTCGPAQLDKMLTEARARMPWLREGSSVPQQQCIRDFGKSRAKAQRDVKDRLPMHRRAGMPRWKKKHEAPAFAELHPAWLQVEARPPPSRRRRRAERGVVAEPST